MPRVSTEGMGSPPAVPLKVASAATPSGQQRQTQHIWSSLFLLLPWIFLPDEVPSPVGVKQILGTGVWTSSFSGVSCAQVPAHLQPTLWAVQQEHPGMGRRWTGHQDLVREGQVGMGAPIVLSPQQWAVVMLMLYSTIFRTSGPGFLPWLLTSGWAKPEGLRSGSGQCAPLPTSYALSTPTLAQR